MSDRRDAIAAMIIVARVADLPEPVSPAERTACAWCGAAVWLGYAVRIDVPFGTPVCVPCALPTISPDEPITIPPEVRREVIEWLLRRRRN